MATRIFGLLQGLVRAVARDKLLLILLAAFGVLVFVIPSGMASVPSLIDWPTMAALCGLLILTKALDMSGALQWLAEVVAKRMPDQRRLALALVLMTCLLSMVLTNDVALFVVVPVTLALAKSTGMPATRLIMFEALAVNAGSALTPIGNPQNLYLWQISNVSFADFIIHMLPLVFILIIVLLGLTALTFKGSPIAITSSPEERLSPIERDLCAAALTLFLPFLIATNFGQALWAVAAMTVLFLWFRRAVLVSLDWGLLVTFLLMFIDLGLVTKLPTVASTLRSWHLDIASHLYWAALGASQIISNVPATIALMSYAHDWRALAYGANIGGFGIFIGSLANLIALRMAGDRKAWLTFHVYSLPFLGLGAGVGYLILFWPGA
ncbi:SLC13 family permease [Asticcacaulis benevestitus]|uniref:Citrate transporter-like domain-containing protein n=1 Tax=Asticcacaulis benevestitus DSM 16100 = ATCC BAA-896 TaxID=1121022 RepID=V4PTH4_9CAUL|nr:SLC13 family permease [Asticcacaulis benevestitus]ESQ90654.1 hypothetical protein ABENE_11825 [Asticcacaulis benevestitus DSM 16100 = ATCC BAA-896]